MGLSLKERLSTARHELEDIPWRVKERLAFIDDPLFEGPLESTNVRLTRNMLDGFEDLLGHEAVDPLRQAIVNRRFLNLRGIAVKMAGHTWLIGSLASRAVPWEQTATQLGMIAAGTFLETRDRNNTFIEVQQAAFPVANALITFYGDDLHGWTNKEALAEELSDAIALGEKLPHPQLTSLIHATLAAAALGYSGQQVWAIGRMFAEPFIQYYLHTTLTEGGNLENLLDRVNELVALDDKLEVLLGEGSIKTLSVNRLKRRIREVFRKLTLTHSTASILLRFGIPIAAGLNTVPGTPQTQLLENLSGLAGAEGDYLEPVFGAWDNFAQARAGILKLQEAVATIKKNQVSLLPPRRLAAHCKEYQHLEPLTIPEDYQEAVAVFAPFRLVLPRREVLLEMDQCLPLFPGFYDLSSPARRGETSLLKALAHWIRSERQEKQQESVIKIHGKWQRLLDLGSSLREFLIYLPREPQLLEFGDVFELEKISPVHLFAPSLLNSDKQSGLSVEEAFKQRLAQYRFELEEISAPLFTAEEIEIIYNTDAFTHLSSDLRAKLRILHALERKPKVLFIDELLDSFDLSTTASAWIYFLGDRCKQNGMTMVVSTSNSLIRRLLREIQVKGVPYYRQTIFIEGSKVATTTDGAGRTVELFKAATS